MVGALRAATQRLRYAAWRACSAGAAANGGKSASTFARASESAGASKSANASKSAHTSTIASESAGASKGASESANASKFSSESASKNASKSASESASASKMVSESGSSSASGRGRGGARTSAEGGASAGGGGLFASLRSDATLFLKVTATAYVLMEFGASLTMCMGPSMEPVIHAAGDVVVIDKLHTLRHGVSAGEIVVLRSPLDHRVHVCKRVVATAGQPVPGRHGQVVPRGMVWVEGDNKQNSTDSRSYGAVPAALVLGRVTYRVYPWRFAGRLD